MTQKDPHTQTSAQSSALNFAPMELATMGKKRLEAAVEMQTELLDKLQEMNREWLARAQSEVDRASELTSKLTAARSLPDVATTCQEWARKRMDMVAEDGRRFVANSQKIMETGARLFSNGRAGDGT